MPPYIIWSVALIEGESNRFFLNTQAVSNQDIVEFLTRSSSAMKEANNTLDETIALGTAATTITRDAASVGTALKTLSMRIRGLEIIAHYKETCRLCSSINNTLKITI